MLIPLESLWIPALFTILFGAWVTVRIVRLKSGVALAISLLKALIPLIYFAYFYDGSWSLLDDLAYFRGGDSLLAAGYNPFLIFFIPSGREQLRIIAGGPHILYFWWNMLAIYTFGPFYSSPIFLNVATTFVSAGLLFKMARFSGCSEKYSKCLSIFFLLHWDVLAWASLINVKDTLLMLLTLAAAYSAILVVKSRKIRHAALLGGTLFIFLWIRYYIPVLILISLIIWMVFAVKGLVKIAWIFAAACAFYLVLPADALDIFQQYYKPDLIMGPLKMALTPQPWTIVPEYSFLFVPSILHWTLFIPAVIAGGSLFRKNRVFRFAAIYFGVTMLFYGLIPELHGSRERLQVTWVLVWAQFQMLWHLIETNATRIRPLLGSRSPLKISHAPNFAPHYRSEHGRR